MFNLPSQQQDTDTDDTNFDTDNSDQPDK